MTLDTQTIFNLIISIAGFLGIFVFNQITRTLAKLEDRVNELPVIYVAKEDYRRDIYEIKSILKQIFDKLDDKADK